MIATNNLKYVSFRDALDAIAAGERVEDGTIIRADTGLIESRDSKHEALDIIEVHTAASDWQVVWGNGVYHYELLVARRGVTEIKDIYDSVCGFSVNGTNKHSC